MDLIERFRYLMKLNQLTASAFADEIGVQRSSVSHILSGRNKPSLEFIQKVLKRFPKVDSSWLISGVTSISSDQVLPEQVAKSLEMVEKQEVPKVKAVKENVVSRENKGDLKGKQVKRVLLFYNDGTFEEFTS